MSHALRDRAPRAVRSVELPEACELPQLEAIVAPGRLARALQEALAAADPAAPLLQRCTVTKVHYRAGRECRLVISARFRAGRRSEEQLYFGRLQVGARSVSAHGAGGVSASGARGRPADDPRGHERTRA